MEELYNLGPHRGNVAFEIGNPDLERELSNGFDFGVRHSSKRVRFEANGFYYHISDFIFLAPTGGVEDGLTVAQYDQGTTRYAGTEARFDTAYIRRFGSTWGSITSMPNSHRATLLCRVFRRCVDASDGVEIQGTVTESGNGDGQSSGSSLLGRVTDGRLRSVQPLRVVPARATTCGACHLVQLFQRWRYALPEPSLVYQGFRAGDGPRAAGDIHTAVFLIRVYLRFLRLNPGTAGWRRTYAKMRFASPSYPRI